MNFNKAIQLGGLAAGDANSAIRVFIDNPDSLPFALTGHVLTEPALFRTQGSGVYQKVSAGNIDYQIYFDLKTGSNVENYHLIVPGLSNKLN